MKWYLVTLFLAHSISQQTAGQKAGVCSICNCLEKSTVNCDSLSLTASLALSAWHDISGPNSTYKEINLSNNFIGRVTPFPNLTVTKISLRNNRIVEIDKLAFKNLTRLLELDLSENELTTNNFMPTIFQGSFDAQYYEPLPIRHLDISGNELHSLNPLLFIHLPHVRYLNLRRNPFQMLDKATVVAISTLQELEILDLSFIQITDLPFGFLHSLRSLKELSLKGNFLKEVPSSVLAESHKLTILNLNLNPITVISSERPFPQIPTLRQLHISDMPELRRIENGSLRGLSGLNFLDCKQNVKLGYVSPLAFAYNESDTSRPNITRLDLNDNALRYLNKSFLDMDKMDHINLQGNRWSCDCENQWMVSELVPILLRTQSPVNGLICSQPPAMEGRDFLFMHKTNYEMRCLDYFGNHPENDSIILVTVFSVVIGVLAIALVLVWKVKIGTCRRGGRVDYSRAFYRQANSEEKY